MTGQPDNSLIKAVTGLEGGCVACGSTCGIVSAGALCMALDHEAEIQMKGRAGEEEALVRAGDFVRWFEAAYGTSICREHTRADFYSTWGQLKYFLTFYRMIGCFRRIRVPCGIFMMISPVKNRQRCRKRPRSRKMAPLHCAGYVLEGIRKNTGIGNRRLEGLSFVFDGGMGLSGGLCGAMAGAVIGINVLVGLPVREQSFWKTAAGFGIGHVNLLMDTPFGPKEPFRAGKQVIREFKKIAGTFACRNITGRLFSRPSEFQEYVRVSETCKNLMDRMVEKASQVVRRYQEDELRDMDNN